MKYIDADRLREELNKWRDIQPTTVGLPRKATYEAMGVIQTIDHVLYLIDKIQQEPLGSPLCGVVYNDSEHLPGLIVDSAQFHDRLKGFPDGAKVDIFIIAKEDK